MRRPTFLVFKWFKIFQYKRDFWDCETLEIVNTVEPVESIKTFEIVRTM